MVNVSISTKKKTQAQATATKAVATVAADQAKLEQAISNTGIDLNLGRITLATNSLVLTDKESRTIEMSPTEQKITFTNPDNVEDDIKIGDNGNDQMEIIVSGQETKTVLDGTNIIMSSVEHPNDQTQI